jgi:copper chaperone CopZ
MWEEIPVEGMTCGGCERRVIANLGELRGVLAVEADAELGKVRVAMARGSALRGAAVERINALGYRAR